MGDNDWEQRVADAWASFGEHSEPEFLALINALASELPPDDPAGEFERASAFDATDREDLAIPLYRQALDHGLAGPRRRQAVIQLASSLRIIGQAAESVSLLTAELHAGSDDLDDAVKAFLALALADLGRDKEAAALALAALAPHLAQYQRAVSHYAAKLLELAALS